MNPIIYFGDLLSAKINKDKNVGQGLILYAIQDEVGNIDTINFDVLKRSFQNSLKSRLEKVGVRNTNNISDEMVKELINKQSLLTMSAV